MISAVSCSVTDWREHSASTAWATLDLWGFAAVLTAFTCLQHSSWVYSGQPRLVVQVLLEICLHDNEYYTMSGHANVSCQYANNGVTSSSPSFSGTSIWCTFKAAATICKSRKDLEQRLRVVNRRKELDCLWPAILGRLSAHSYTSSPSSFSSTTPCRPVLDKGRLALEHKIWAAPEVSFVLQWLRSTALGGTPQLGTLLSELQLASKCLLISKMSLLGSLRDLLHHPNCVLLEVPHPLQLPCLNNLVSNNARPLETQVTQSTQVQIMRAFAGADFADASASGTWRGSTSHA